MTSSQKIGLGVVLALVAITSAFLGALMDKPAPAVGGGSYTALPASFGGGITVGTSGTSVSQVITGTCNLVGMDSSQVATTSAAYACAATGARSGDLVFASLNTATPKNASFGWAVLSTKASTTADYITVVVGNMSGASAVPSATAVGSSTQYVIIR